MANVPLIAEGNISPRRVVMKGAGDFGCLQSNATPGSPPLGISNEATRRPANSPLDDTFAAIANEEIRVYQLGEHALADAGAVIAAFDWVKPDANGRIVTASTGNYYVGQALQAATVSNQQILVKVQPGTL